MKSAFAILTFFAFLTTGFSAATQDDVWFFADFDSPAELNGMAFLRELPSGNGITEAGVPEGKFGSGYAFIGPKTRCNGMFWRESRPEALGEFPWKEGSFSCWYKSPEGMADAEASPAFAFGGFKWTGDKFQTCKYSGGWLDLASSHDRKGEWRHFAAVWCDDELAVYRDGEKIASRKKPQRADPFSEGAPCFEIGTAGYGTCAANLVLDEVGIFRRALTVEEIKALASATSGLRAGKLSILATPPGMAIYYRNEANAAIRQRVFSPEKCTLRLTGEVGGKPIKGREVRLPAGVSDFDVPFEVSRYLPGKYEWSFKLTDGTGKMMLDRKGTLTVCGSMERDGFKVLSWGGNKPISPDFLSMLGVNTVNVHLGHAEENGSRLHVETAEFNYDFYGTYREYGASKPLDWYALNKNGAIAGNKSTSAKLQSYVWALKVTPRNDGEDYSNISFSFVEGDDTNQIMNYTISEDNEIEGIYTVNGMKVDEPVKGVNIIRFMDGKTKKIYVK